MPSKKEREFAARLGSAADVVGVSFFLLASIVFLLGEFTELLSQVPADHAGKAFVFTYFCPAADRLVDPFLTGKNVDKFGLVLSVEGIIVLFALIYRWICFFLLRSLVSLFR